jgi:hypothetical protein
MFLSAKTDTCVKANSCRRAHATETMPEHGLKSRRSVFFCGGGAGSILLTHVFRLYNNEADPIVEMLEVVERRFKSEWVKAGLPLDEQGNPAAPEQEDSDAEEGGSDVGAAKPEIAELLETCSALKERCIL